MMRSNKGEGMSPKGDRETLINDRKMSKSDEKVLKIEGD